MTHGSTNADPPLADPPLAVVTGSCSGIGRAVTMALLGDGYRVIGLDIAAAPALGGSYVHLQRDLSSMEALNTAEAALAAAIGGRETKAFVHSAGVMRGDASPDLAADGGAALWTLHVAAPQRLAALLLPRMRSGDGRIVVISSRASQGRAGRGLYAASKAGSEALVRSLALQTMTRGVTVNAVAPGPVATAQSVDPGRADAPVATPPIGRMIAAEEIAATVLFLLSTAAGAVTGQTIVQCGGLSLAPPAPDLNSNAELAGGDP